MLTGLLEFFVYLLQKNERFHNPSFGLMDASDHCFHVNDSSQGYDLVHEPLILALVSLF